LLHFNKYKVVVLIDYESIYKIVYHDILNTISIDRINRRLINISVYLSIYQFDIYYILGRLNFVSDTLLRLRTLKDDVVRKDNIKPVLNAL